MKYFLHEFQSHQGKMKYKSQPEMNIMSSYIPTLVFRVQKETIRTSTLVIIQVQIINNIVQL